VEGSTSGEKSNSSLPVLFLFYGVYMNLYESPCRLCKNYRDKVNCLLLKCEKLLEYQKESYKIRLECSAIDTTDEDGYKIIQ
jgi:hypothetical protein